MNSETDIASMTGVRLPLSPRELPEAFTAMRSALDRYLARGMPQEWFTDPEHGAVRRELFDVMAAAAPIMRDPGCSLLWITSEVSQIADVASATVPVDFVLTAEVLAFSHGFAVVEGRDHFNLVTWKLSEGWLTVVPYDWEMFPVAGPDAVWKLGEPLGSESDGLVAEDYLGRRNMTLRWFAALALIASQPNIVETEDESAPRGARRRAERSNTVLPLVRVVTVRGIGRSGTGPVSDRHLTKRFIVRGHWRNQAYGPQQSLRRPTWIAPHIKGPEGAPLDVRPTVFRVAA